MFDHVRKLFAATTEAKVRGYLPGRFSFNVKGGRCEACSGDGTLKIEMQFLPDVYVPCEVCHGARYNTDTLAVHYKGKTIADVLDMPIEAAAVFFAAIPAIHRHLEPSPTSAWAMSAWASPRPAVGGGGPTGPAWSELHAGRPAGRSTCWTSPPPACISRTSASCSGVLGRLVDGGNTVIVIEHNLDVIKTADHVIDLGPDGGSRGGHIIATGTPEQDRHHRDQPHRPVPPQAPRRLAPSTAAGRNGAGHDLVRVLRRLRFAAWRS